MASRQTGASGKGKGKASTNSSTPPYKVSANADGVPRSSGKQKAQPASVADSVPPKLPAVLTGAYEGTDAKENSEGDGDLSVHGDVFEPHDEFGSHDDALVYGEDEGDRVAELLAMALKLIEQYHSRPAHTDVTVDPLVLFTENPPTLTERQRHLPPATPSSLADKFTPMRLKYTPGLILEHFRKNNIPVIDSLTPAHIKGFENFFAEKFGGLQEYKYVSKYSWSPAHGHSGNMARPA